MFEIPGDQGRALSDGAARHFSPLDVELRLAEMIQMLGEHKPRTPIGLVGDNSPEWVLADLALLRAGYCGVPIPAFFTSEQISHLVAATGMTQVFHRGGIVPVRRLFPYLPETAVAGAPLALPARTQKITFTSGTTGSPKGVCLSASQQMATVKGLAKVLGRLGVKKHLSLLPLAVLLENVAGIYVPLMLGAECIVPPLAEIGLSGSSQFDAERCLNAIGHHQAESLIVLPQMLQALVWQAKPADPRLASLKFVAVGGGVTPVAALARAAQVGMPVFEGYGLSECASVVSLNTPTANRPGSVGKTLPGVKARLAGDGEIEIQGRAYIGLLGEPPLPAQAWIATGDLGDIDSDGYLHITGRKKNVLITSFGRNVSPEWPEGLLMASGLLAQVVVTGDGEAQLRALLVPRDAAVDQQALATMVGAINARLPDYAQIGQWLICREGFTRENGLATDNGRLRRDAIARHFSNLAANWQRTQES